MKIAANNIDKNKAADAHFVKTEHKVQKIKNQEIKIVDKIAKISKSQTEEKHEAIHIKHKIEKVVKLVDQHNKNSMHAIKKSVDRLAKRDLLKAINKSIDKLAKHDFQVS